MRKLILTIAILLVPVYAHAEELIAHFRPQPPLMQEVNGKFTGPLVTIAEEAARSLGYSLRWKKADFEQSMEDLKFGRVDIVPQVFRQSNRESYVAFAGPFGYKNLPIHFVTQRGNESIVSRFSDLYKYTVIINGASAHYDRIDSDPKVRKHEVTDNYLIARMIARGRYKIALVSDMAALEKVFQDIGYESFSYTEFVDKVRVGLWFAMPKRKRELHRKFSNKLQEMATTNRISEIYQREGVKPPNE